MNFFTKCLASVFVGFCITSVSFAQTDTNAAEVSIVNQWYSAISPVQDAASMRDKVGVLLADDAMIDLQDLEIAQSREEYLESLDPWSEAISAGFVAHKIRSAEGGQIVVDACYDFGENALHTEETFIFMQKQISKSTQKTVAENCDDF